MAKKKSKTQNYKKSQQRKQKKVLKEQGVVVETKPKTSSKKSSKTNEIKNTTTVKKNTPKKKIVKNDQVLYNVALTNPNIIKNRKKAKTNNSNNLKLNKIKKDDKNNKFFELMNKLEDRLPKKEIVIEKVKKQPKKASKIVLNENFKKKLIIILTIIKNFFITIGITIRNVFSKLIIKLKEILIIIKDFLLKLYKIIKVCLIKNYKFLKSKIIKELNNKDIKIPKKNIKEKKIIKESLKASEVKKEKKVEEQIILPKLKDNNKNQKKYQKILSFLWNERYIVFNAILILTFVFLLIGMIRVKVYSKGNIMYVSSLLLFLILVAISHNKHISGNIFTILLCTGMIITICTLQYNYDFINNLNTKQYEYKTYYVVTFDNSLNKSIYNINNKKVGLLKDNEKNIERKLNTKLDKVNYIEFDNLTELYNEFYDQKFRAVIVTENQYKYLLNNETTGAKSVKILYEFEVNAKK